MENRGRGRARGISRGQAGGQQPPRPGQQGGPRPAPGQPQHPSGQPSAQGAWAAPRPVPVQQAPQQSQHASWGKLGSGPVPPTGTVVGRGARPAGGGDESGQLVVEKVLAGVGSGAPVEARPNRGNGGNGGVRGRTIRNDYLVTKPTNMPTKQGASGTPIALCANFFKLLQAGKWVLLQYRVDYNIEIDNTFVKKKLLHQALHSAESDIKGYLFDGTVLYTAKRINPDPREFFVETENEGPARITIRFVSEVAWGDHHYLQVFNIIIRKCLVVLKLQLVGRNYYDPNCAVNLDEFNLILWPGYYTSMRQHEKDILLNCEIIFKVMRGQNMLDLLMESDKRDLRKDYSEKVLGTTVLTTYNNKMYKIDDIDWNAKPTSTFQKKDGTTISYLEYYEKRYSVKITNRDQPMLISRSRPREIRAGMPELIVLVPELCKVTGLTDRQRENFKLMRALADETRVGPQQRMDRLQRYSKRMVENKDVMEILSNWDFKLAQKLIEFQGRVLPPETILFGGNKSAKVNQEADWTRELRTSEMFNPGKLERMALICPKNILNSLQDFMSMLDKAARGMRWSLGNYRPFPIDDDRTGSYIEKIESAINSGNPTLVLCVLTRQNTEKYSAIKKKTLVDRGCPSQVICARNLTSKGAMSIATKVAIQLNCKVGGSPWAVTMPLSKLMVVGYDVCRDTANKSKSFAGMVASLDKAITRYYNMVTEHKYEEELSDHFSAFILTACHKYKEVNGFFPEKILIYRDGVGDGQIPYVHSHEVTTIKKKLSEEIYKNPGELKLAFVIVSKRINTRIFSRVQGGQNPPPGTVVDDVITLPERYDFFIVSQCVRQGTVAPTSYNVIEDTMGLPADRMQMLTYKLTHLYFNWSGTVRVPAPCQYAHKLAFLVAQHLHRPVHRSLENTLYYL